MEEEHDRERAKLQEKIDELTHDQVRSPSLQLYSIADRSLLTARIYDIRGRNPTPPSA